MLISSFTTHCKQYTPVYNLAHHLKHITSSLQSVCMRVVLVLMGLLSSLSQTEVLHKVLIYLAMYHSDFDFECLKNWLKASDLTKKNHATLRLLSVACLMNYGVVQSDLSKIK